jgi:hypothetical protein
VDKKHRIPSDWEEFIGELSQNEYFLAAWEYAAKKGNVDENGFALPKACYAFADAHWQDFQPGGTYGPAKDEDPQTLQEEINRLMARKERLESAPS